jgi:hypothetical protein
VEAIVNWILLAALVTSPIAILAAWAMWLLFNLRIAESHGLEALKATPTVAKAFVLLARTLVVPRQILSSIRELFANEPRL